MIVEIWKIQESTKEKIKVDLNLIYLFNPQIFSWAPPKYQVLF